MLCMRESGLVVGTADAVIDELNQYAEVGVQRVMLQWLELDDMAGLEAMAKTVLPQITR